MVHGDDKGLVLPPSVAQTQVVIIPVLFKDDDATKLLEKAEELRKVLKAAKIRVELDDRENYNPGFKYNHWELRGVPLRLELGKKDFEKQEVRMCKRNDGTKSQVKWDGIAETILAQFPQIHTEMYNKALKSRENHMSNVTNWEDFMAALGKRNICMAPWCDVQQCEVDVKDRSKEESLSKMEAQNEDEVLLTGSAKTLCIPFDQPELAAGTKCFACGKDAKCTALWGRSY